MSAVFAVVVLLVGLAILVAGLYYLNKEKADKDSVKIYGIMALIGAAVAIGSGVYLFVGL
ncbi:MAG: hypothetical protein ACK5L3_12445 [Oscillospiraceae bacterium]